ncbi:hypothetical protein TNCV_1879421 [Trichonephila clavipes]|nr:hypothetical protein TNCV_1879421 [Trichonephila clavipes]
MLINFFVSQSVIHSEFLPERTTMNAESQYRQTAPDEKEGEGVQWEHPPLNRSQSSRLLPISTTQTRFEKKDLTIFLTSNET